MSVRLDDDRFRLDGRLAVDDLAELWEGISIELEDRDEYDTVGGLVFHRVGRVPRPGDTVDLGPVTLTVESTDGRRVGKLLATRERPPDEPATDDADR